MSSVTNIEWTDSTWSPIRAKNLNTGKIGWFCTHVSEACRNCYAEGMNKRLGTGLDYKPGNVGAVAHFLDEKMLLAPLRWKKPRRIFVCSTTDIFGDWVKEEWLDQMFAVMALSPQHTFQVLSKRSGRMRSYFSDPETPFRVAKAADALESIDGGPEEIRPIVGYPGYFVSSRGLVLTEHRGPRRAMKPDVGEQGHSRVQLHREVSGRYGDRLLVHRIILETFVGPAPTPDTQGRHRDGNPQNNAVGNLQWGDQPSNWSDSKRHGTYRRYSKLTPDQVAAIRARHATGETGQALAREYDVSATQIRNIAAGRQWNIEPPITWPLVNCWLGVTAEDQKTADERIPNLLATPAAKRFVSIEPMLGPVDLIRIDQGDLGSYNVLDAVPEKINCGLIPDRRHPAQNSLDWVICGGESGPHARPVHPDWARSLRDQCDAAGVPFFFKQWGEWREFDHEGPTEQIDDDSDAADSLAAIASRPAWIALDGHIAYRRFDLIESLPMRMVERVGKRAAGRLLDGVEHSEFPRGPNEART